jgi:hypothetical protein
VFANTFFVIKQLSILAIYTQGAGSGLGGAGPNAAVCCVYLNPARGSVESNWSNWL